jgi:3D (Asp-Asp-Asp) domain-containing protein
MNLHQKIAQARKELSRDKKGKFNKKHDPFLLWGEYPHGWQMIKDLILCFVLFSFIIGNAKYIDLSVLTATRTVVIVNEAQADVKEVQTPTLSTETPHSAEFGQIGEFTAYSAGDGFTPGTVMANGKEVEEGMIACPSKYVFGTKIEVEGNIYECADRMAKRFRDGNYFDMYMDDIESAKKFGRKQLKFNVIK